MITALHNSTISLFFRIYIKIVLRRTYRRIQFSGVFCDSGRPLLLISNHISWWDGLWNFYFNHKYLHRRFHVMISEKELVKRPFIRRIGGFSIHKGNRSSVESLRYAGRLLADPHNMVLIYPQGKIASVYKQTFEFQRGTAYILSQFKEPVSIMFIAYFTETSKYRKPSLWGYFKECPAGDNLQEKYQEFYNEALSVHINNVSE